MPLTRADAEQPPQTMTWAKASPVFVVSVLFDALRLMCQQLWFFGPALAALYCTSEGGAALSSWTFGALGTKTAGFACSVGATVIGAYGLPVIEVMGIILAIAVGLIGWMTIGLMLITSNRRIFKENAGNSLWFIGSLLISEVPFVGTIPALTGTLFKMYSVQIRTEKAALTAYHQRQETLKVQERQMQAAQLMQMRAAQARSEQDSAQAQMALEAEAIDEASDEIPEERPAMS